MANTNHGGPAFPSHGDMGEVVQTGMTLRDWFAGEAMGNMFVRNRSRALVQDEETIARAAYAFADAMLRAREE